MIDGQRAQGGIMHVSEGQREWETDERLSSGFDGEEERSALVPESRLSLLDSIS